MTTAANDLYTSQPNVSRLVARLEKSLGLKLFNRVGGRLVPTDEGQAFCREVERSFIGLKSLESAAKGIREFGTGRCASPLRRRRVLRLGVARRWQTTADRQGLRGCPGHSQTARRNTVGAAMCTMVGLGLGVSIVSPLSDLTFPTFLLSSPHRPLSLLAKEFAALLKRLFAAEILEYDAI